MSASDAPPRRGRSSRVARRPPSSRNQHRAAAKPTWTRAGAQPATYPMSTPVTSTTSQP